MKLPNELMFEITRLAANLDRHGKVERGVDGAAKRAQDIRILKTLVLTGRVWYSRYAKELRHTIHLGLQDEPVQVRKVLRAPGEQLDRVRHGGQAVVALHLVIDSGRSSSQPIPHVANPANLARYLCHLRTLSIKITRFGSFADHVVAWLESLRQLPPSLVDAITIEVEQANWRIWSALVAVFGSGMKAKMARVAVHRSAVPDARSHEASLAARLIAGIAESPELEHLELVIPLTGMIPEGAHYGIKTLRVEVDDDVPPSSLAKLLSSTEQVRHLTLRGGELGILYPPRADSFRPVAAPMLSSIAVDEWTAPILQHNVKFVDGDGKVVQRLQVRKVVVPLSRVGIDFLYGRVSAPHLAEVTAIADVASGTDDMANQLEAWGLAFGVRVAVTWEGAA